MIDECFLLSRHFFGSNQINDFEVPKFSKQFSSVLMFRLDIKTSLILKGERYNVLNGREIISTVVISTEEGAELLLMR